MTFAPQTLLDLQALWVSKGGVPLGIVGDAAHAARSSYHNGFDVACKASGVMTMTALAAKDYSFQLARDRRTSNAAAAIDFGKLGGSLAGLQKFSRWFVEQVRADPIKYRDVREVIFSPDGVIVQRWDNEAKHLYLGGTGTGQGDDSHRTHTHISAHRDSEPRDKRVWIAAYFAPSPEADMLPLATYTPGQTITVKPTSNVRADAKLAAAILRVVPATPEVWTIVGSVKGDVDGGSDVWYLRWWAGHWEYTAKSNVTSGPTAPVVDCKAAANTAYDEGVHAALAASTNGITSLPKRGV